MAECEEFIHFNWVDKDTHPHNTINYIHNIILIIYILYEVNQIE